MSGQGLPDLERLLANVVRPVGLDETRVYAAKAVPGYVACRVAVAPNGSPALLVRAGDGPAAGLAYQLEHVRVEHGIGCVVTTGDGSHTEERLSVVEYRGNDEDLRRHFVRSLTSVVAVLGGTPTGSDVVRAVERLVELFRSMGRTARAGTQGLWAELLLMCQASDPMHVARCWHVTPGDVFDFNDGVDRLEVKSTAGRVRRHHFTLDQARPPVGTRAVIASLRATSAGGGVSVADLVDNLRSRLAADADLLLRVDEVVAGTLGDSWRMAAEQRFDRELALATLAFYDARDVPSVSATLPVGVSDVRFVADLEMAAQLDHDEMRARGGLFSAAAHAVNG